jgi:hypothetical protein
MKFKPGDIIVSTDDTTGVRRVQVFETYGIPLEYNHCWQERRKIGEKVDSMSCNNGWGDYWVLDEASLARRILKQYENDNN